MLAMNKHHPVLSKRDIKSGSGWHRPAYLLHAKFIKYMYKENNFVHVTL
jgi:hypothetical protein